MLADRRFGIKESVGLHCATLVVHASTKGKNQLSGIEVEQSRNIDNVRIHVEHVIEPGMSPASIMNFVFEHPHTYYSKLILGIH